MALFKKIINPFGQISIWEINESVKDLLIQIELTEKEKREYANISNEKRKKEFLIIRILLKDLLDKESEITYNPYGKPTLNNSNLNISISHSNDFVVIFISKHNIGVDVENTLRNIDKVAKRFLSSNEKVQVKNSDNPKLTTFIYWCAKEAIFKCTDEQEIAFNKQIIIEKFKLANEGNFKGQFISESERTEYQLNYFFINNNAFVYCVEK